MPKPIEERFWNKVAKGAGCWEWTAAEQGRGYGAFGMHGRMHLAHRIAWLLTYGEVPDGLFVCHHCDNRKCVRPDHLFLGTNLDNMRDCAKKGRWGKPRDHSNAPRGEQIPNSKLKKENVIEMHRLWKEGAKQKDIAAKFGITQSHASAILNGGCWAHVGPERNSCPV